MLVLRRFNHRLTDLVLLVAFVVRLNGPYKVVVLVKHAT